MIDRLNGTLVEKTPATAVVTTGGVGFRVQIAVSTFDALPPEGEPVLLFTHLAVKEDDLTLYGFSTPEERSVFQRLIQVNGVGPRIAISALGGLSLPDLKQAIAEGDHKRLTAIPGIGKKMAERLVVELRDTFEKETAFASSQPESSLSAGPERDALLALVALGHKQQEARQMIENVQKHGEVKSVEELIRRALGGT